MIAAAWPTLHWAWPAQGCDVVAIEIPRPPRKLRPRRVRSDQALITCRECDRKYRLRSGATATQFHLNNLPGERRGRAIYVSAKRAHEMFGI